MRLAIRHRTVYRYSEPVFLEPHFLRLRPRTDPAQQVIDYALRVDPEPAGRSESLDAEGNWLICIWFQERLERLDLEATLTAETGRSNPFDFLLASADFPPAGSLYPDALRARLAACLACDDWPASAALARSLEPRGPVLDFLARLNDELHRRCRVVVRTWGAPWPPDRTLAAGQGACRDLAMVFVAACRAVGLAARFTSGFVAGGDPDQARFLHAWAEVYLPGAGWRGFDPTENLVVADRHLCVAASASHHGAVPVEGAFRGTGVGSEMDAEIEVAVV